MAHDYDLVIIGMGSGGLTAAKFAASLNLRVAAIERDRVGGDCLWTGCVPSKALLASAKVAQRMRTADSYGLTAVDPEIDRNAVWERIRRIQHEIAAAEDNAEHYEQLGVEVVLGTAQLAGPHSVRVGSRTLDTKFVLLCTGSRPAVPPIEGLEATGYLTSEYIFELEDVPSSFVVIGGGPIAVELAQGLNRLGADVQVLQAPPRILAREEPELSDTLTGVLELEGVRIALGARAERISRDGSSKVVTGTADGSATEWRAEELNIATGRTPTTLPSSTSSASSTTRDGSPPMIDVAPVFARSTQPVMSRETSSSRIGPDMKVRSLCATCFSQARRSTQMSFRGARLPTRSLHVSV